MDQLGFAINKREGTNYINRLACDLDIIDITGKKKNEMLKNVKNLVIQ